MDYQVLPGTLPPDDAENLALSVGHWAGHMSGPGLGEVYPEQIRMLHERLHDEVESLLPAEPDASIMLLVNIDVRDTSVPCLSHPMFARMPAGPAVAALRFHRHCDGTTGIEAGGDYLCHVLGALAAYGGTVSASVHGPRPTVGQDEPASPVAAAAAWRVDPAGVGVPVQDRPAAMFALSDLTDPAATPDEPDQEARRAFDFCVRDGGTVQGWLGGDPWRFLRALARALDALGRQPELTNPVARQMAALLCASRAGDKDEDDYGRYVLRAAGAQVNGDESAITDVIECFAADPVDAVRAAKLVTGWVAICWRAMLGGYLTLPQAPIPSPEWDAQNQAGLDALNALADRVLGCRPARQG